MSRHLTRQFDLIPLACLGTPVTVIGAGAIGGMTVFTLAKMGFNQITVIDFDTVEIHNLNSQFYRFKDIGKPKVVALSDLVEDFTGLRIEARVEKYVGLDTFAGIVVSAVDSMAVRRQIWEAHAGTACSTVAILDGRMGAEQALFYAMKPMNEKDREDYPKSLYSDSESIPEPCTARSTAYCAFSLAALVAQTVKDLAAGFNYCRSAAWNIKRSQLSAWRTT